MLYLSIVRMGILFLSDTYYRLVKGEVLGLRAMMHLDLLRMFGPIYSEENKGNKMYPIYDESGSERATVVARR